MAEQEVISISVHDKYFLAVIECAEMDEDRTKVVQERFLQAAAQARPLPMVLDLSRVTFLPSLSIGALISFMTELKKFEQRFILVDIQPPIREVLALTKLEKVFEIYDDVDTALEHIGEG